MTVISNDPSWSPIISNFREYSYYEVTSFVIVVYDWALTFGQEVELIWRQRWSIMTVLYLGVRYIGIPFTVFFVLSSLPSVSLTDRECLVFNFTCNWVSIVTNVMVGVIMIIRLHAMYQRCRKMLVLLVATFMAVQVTTSVITVMYSRHDSGVEYVLSGAHLCGYDYPEGALFVCLLIWAFATAWEILAMCLAVWIAVKHLRELRRASTGWAAGDCFTVLIKTHMLYFASFVAVSCLQLIGLSTQLSDSSTLGSEVFDNGLQIARVVQSFVLGPRLILGVRDYYAKLVTNSDEGTNMISIAFQERIHVTTGGGV